MDQLMYAAFLDELEKIAGVGLDRIMKAGLGRLTRSAEGAVEAGVGQAKMPFIPMRGAGKVLGQDVKQMMQTPQVKGALKLRNPTVATQAQKAQAAYKDIDVALPGGRAGAFHGETVSPARATVTDIGRGVRTPQQLAESAASMRNKMVGMESIPSPHVSVPAPATSLSRGSIGAAPIPVSTTPMQATTRFIPQRSGVFSRGATANPQPSVSAVA